MARRTDFPLFNFDKALTDMMTTKNNIMNMNLTGKEEASIFESCFALPQETQITTAHLQKEQSGTRGPLMGYDASEQCKTSDRYFHGDKAEKSLANSVDQRPSVAITFSDLDNSGGRFRQGVTKEMRIVFTHEYCLKCSFTLLIKHIEVVDYGKLRSLMRQSC